MHFYKRLFGNRIMVAELLSAFIRIRQRACRHVLSCLNSLKIESVTMKSLA